MIGYLAGRIIDKDPRTLTVLAGGVGYRVFVTGDLLSESTSGSQTELFIHTAVREDDISLYGFLTKEDLKFFELLLTVSGIGPKMSMEILSTPLKLTKNAILSGDVALLTKIKGLGKKTAERLCLELKNKIEPVFSASAGKTDTHAPHDDAVMALETLGYERYQILRFMNDLPAHLTRTEEIVTYFLKAS